MLGKLGIVHIHVHTHLHNREREGQRKNLEIAIMTGPQAYY